MKRIHALSLSLSLSLSALSAQSYPESFTDATTIAEGDKVWMIDVSETGANRDRDATLEQIVSPFAADPSTNSSFDAAAWALDLNAAIAPAWGNITGTPTTLSGYGIADAYTQAAANAAFEPAGVAAADLTDATLDGIALVTAADANPFADADESKLDGIEALATADQTNAEILAAFETESGRDVSVDGSKLDGIEALADVTDTANVTSAGALMDSEVDADLKTLSLPASTTISAFGATLADDADAATARSTLGLDNVDNTADADKPISTATQAELDAALNRDKQRAFAGGVRMAKFASNQTTASGNIEVPAHLSITDPFFISLVCDFAFTETITENDNIVSINAGSGSSASTMLDRWRSDDGSYSAGEIGISLGARYGTGFIANEARSYQFLLTYDGSDLKFYADGNLEFTQASPNLTNASDGAISLGESTGGFSQLAGSLRDFASGNFALTADEAAELSSNGLEAFIAAHPEYKWADASEGETYTADWSAGVDGWLQDSAGAVAGNQDSIGPAGDLRDDCLTYTSATSSRAGFRWQDGTLEVGMLYKVTFDYFTPTGSDFIGLDFKVGAAFVSENFITDGGSVPIVGDAWTSVEIEILAGDARLELKQTSGGSSLGEAMTGFGSDDDLSIRNLKVTQVGIVAALPLDEGIGYQHRDLSSNHLDALASATGVYHLKTKREGSLRAFGIDAYNGGSGDVELVSSSRDVFPLNAIIKESFVRNNGGGSIASGALDVKRSNRTTRNIIGDNGGVLDGGLVENITITAQQTPTYNNVALDSSDADATDIDVRIDYELID